MATTLKQAPLLSIIILNYFTDTMTFRLAKKLQCRGDVEVIVVDNSSSKRLRKEVESLKKTKYINPRKNLGFAGGVNLGIKHSKGKWIFLLNSDAETELTMITKLLDISIKKDVMVATPRLINENGETEKNVGIFSSFFQNPLNWLFLRPRYILPKKKTYVDTTTGGALLISRSVIKKVGLFDAKNFFLYFEDMDFSLRLHKADIKIFYVPSCVIRHIGGYSSKKNPTQKNQKYHISLNNYLLKYRGPFFVWVNNIFHFLR